MAARAGRASKKGARDLLEQVAGEEEVEVGWQQHVGHRTRRAPTTRAERSGIGGGRKARGRVNRSPPAEPRGEGKGFGPRQRLPRAENGQRETVGLSQNGYGGHGCA